MNAIPEQPVPIPIPNDWGAIYTAVNAWRGECMHHFSSVELAVTRTLLALEAARPDDTAIQLRHLIGQRFEDLAKAIGPGGPFAHEGGGAAGYLAHFRERQEAFRAWLCHGNISVSVDSSGHWVLVLRTLSIRGRQAETGLDVIDQSTAERRLQELRTDGRKLTAALGKLREAAAAGQAAKRS